MLEWVAISFSRGSYDPGIMPGSPALLADSLPSEPPGKFKCLRVTVNVVKAAGRRETGAGRRVWVATSDKALCEWVKEEEMWMLRVPPFTFSAYLGLNSHCFI